MCAAKSPDGNWYRSRIIASSSSNYFEVHYIDYGNSEKISKSNIKILETVFCKLSALAVKTYLPIKAEHDLEIVKTAMVELTAGFPLSLDIIEFYKGNWIVDLSSSGSSLITLLVSRNVAKKLDLIQLHEIIDNISIVEEILPEVIEPEVVVELVEEIQTNPNRIEAVISHTDNPGRFYLQLKTDIEKVDKLQENLQIVASQLPSLTEYKIDVLCIAQYSIDDLWYRAKIIDVGNGVVTIQFIDYGNTEVFASLSEMELKIKEMNDAFIGYKEYTISCSLPVGPTGREFSEAACQLIYDASGEPVTFEYISTGVKNYVKVYWKEMELSEILLTKNLANSLEVIKSGEECFVCHINSLNDFYVQLERDSSSLEIIADYCLDIEKFEILTKPIVGLICLAKFPDDGSWYRAKILNVEKIEVHFIDYGNQAFTDELRLLPKEIADLPVLSKKCCLFLPENLNKWTEMAETKFDQLSDTGATTFKVELKTPHENYVTIELYLNGKNIIDELLVKETTTPTTLVNNNATISYLNSPTDFYIQLESKIEKLNDLSKILEIENLVVQTNPVEGELCIATFPNDSKNYRAKILTIANDGFDVLFIDYGFVSFVKETYFLKESLRCQEALAIHCALNDLNLNLNLKFNKKFYEETSVENRTFQFTVIDETVDPKIIELYSNGENINFLCEEIIEEIIFDDTIPSINEKSEEVKISHINSANDFFIQFQNHKLDEIAQVLENIDESLTIYENPIEGEICIATYPEDNKKYRAKILTVGTDGCIVIFIDYGNKSNVKKLYEIPASLKLEPLAINCTLFNRFETWNESSSKYFYAATTNCEKLFKYKIIDETVEPVIIQLNDNELNLNEEMMKLLEPRSPNEAEGAAEQIVNKLVDESIKSCFDSIELDEKKMQTEIIDEILKEVEKKVDEVVLNKLKTLDEMNGSFTSKLNRRLSLNDLSKCIKEQVVNSFASSGSGSCDLRMFGGFGDPLDSIRSSMSSSKSNEQFK